MLSRKFTEHHFQMIESTVACISLLQQDTGEQENPLLDSVYSIKVHSFAVYFFKVVFGFK